jgi:hypothetical protein
VLMALSPEQSLRAEALVVEVDVHFPGVADAAEDPAAGPLPADASLPDDAYTRTPRQNAAFFADSSPRISSAERILGVSSMQILGQLWGQLRRRRN